MLGISSLSVGLVVTICERTAAGLLLASTFEHHGWMISSASVLALSLFYKTRLARWPAVPLIPALCTSVLSLVVDSPFLTWTTCITSFMTLAASIFFPQPSLPAPTGKYGVGCLDVSAPSGNDDVLLARVLYPVHDRHSRKVRYIKGGRQQSLAFMKFGAPEFLWKFMPFFLDVWQLVGIWAGKQEPIAVKSEGQWPVCIFSHGNGGARETYSSITTDIASHGYVVIVLEHRDGTSYQARGPGHVVLEYDTSIKSLKTPQYEWQRRKQAVFRVQETLQALELAKHMNLHGLDVVDFSNKLDLNRVILAGHSFGGATALGALAAYSNMLSDVHVIGCILYDPAIDWAMDGIRQIFLDTNTIGTPQENPDSYSHDLNLDERARNSVPLMFLYSSEWKHYESAKRFSKFSREGVFANGSAVQYIQGSMHPTLSDAGLLLPSFLARTFGLIGSNSAVKVLEAQRIFTRHYLKALETNDLTSWFVGENAESTLHPLLSHLE